LAALVLLLLAQWHGDRRHVDLRPRQCPSRRSQAAL